MLANRTTRIAMSPTMKVAADALRLKREGVDVVDLGAGEHRDPRLGRELLRQVVEVEVARLRVEVHVRQPR